MDIVCGDALGISCGMWLASWNGVIGAFVATVVGGLVARQAVPLTDRQQKRHAADAREVAAIADVIAVAETMALNWQEKSYDTEELSMKFRAALAVLPGHG